MAEHEGFLHEDEQRALAAGDGDLLRSDVMLSARQFTEELELPTALSDVILERVGQKLDDMSGKKLRKAAKAFGKVAGSFTVAAPHEEAVEAVETVNEPVSAGREDNPGEEAQDRFINMGELSEEELAVEAEAVEAVEVPETPEASESPKLPELPEVPEPDLPYHERIARVWFEDEEESAALSDHLNPSAKLTAEGSEARQEAVTTLRQRIADIDSLEKVASFTPQELINLRTLLGWFRTVEGDEQRFVAATPLSQILKSKSFTASKRVEVARAVQNGLQKLTDAVL